MEIGDRVKVTRIDDYTASIYKIDNTPSPLGMIGVVVEMRYNPNMHRQEVVVLTEGMKCVWEPWNLTVIKSNKY